MAFGSLKLITATAAGKEGCRKGPSAAGFWSLFVRKANYPVWDTEILWPRSGIGGNFPCPVKQREKGCCFILARWITDARRGSMGRVPEYMKAAMLPLLLKLPALSVTAKIPWWFAPRTISAMAASLTASSPNAIIPMIAVTPARPASGRPCGWNGYRKRLSAPSA